MEISKIIDLMAKKMGKSATVEELAELESLLAKHPSYTYLGEVVESLKGSPEHFEKNIPGKELADNGWRHLADRLNAEGENPAEEDRNRTGGEPEGNVGNAGVPGIRGRRGLWRMLPSGISRRVVAAAIVLIAGAGAVLFYRGHRSPLTPGYASKSLNAGYGGQTTLVLADGTRVWLNAGSRLIYPEAFSGTSREVELQGEAFFDVAQQAARPFLVHAGKITVKVLGTRFNVKAYQGDADISTTLISGKVQVMMNDDPEKKILLSPHEKLTVVNSVAAGDRPGGGSSGNELRYQVQSLPVADHDSFPETAWLENKLVVSNETFEEVARVLERRYDVQIEFGNSALKQEHLSGIFEKETIQQVLDILKMTTKFNYIIDGKRIRLVKDL